VNFFKRFSVLTLLKFFINIHIVCGYNHGAEFSKERIAAHSAPADNAADWMTTL